MSGLEALLELDVLDLHNNYIEKAEGISHLRSLRILNLAGNRLSLLGHELRSLPSLTELNLRRNLLTSLVATQGEREAQEQLGKAAAEGAAAAEKGQPGQGGGTASSASPPSESSAAAGGGGGSGGGGVASLPATLQRLFLSHNKIGRGADLQPLGGATALVEASGESEAEGLVLGSLPPPLALALAL